VISYCKYPAALREWLTPLISAFQTNSACAQLITFSIEIHLSAISPWKSFCIKNYPENIPSNRSSPSPSRRRLVRAESTRKSLQDYEMAMLRKYQLSLKTTNVASSFTGLQTTQKMNLAYASTSHYLRQAVGVEKMRHGHNGVSELNISSK